MIRSSSERPEMCRGSHPPRTCAAGEIQGRAPSFARQSHRGRRRGCSPSPEPPTVTRPFGATDRWFGAGPPRECSMRNDPSAASNGYKHLSSSSTPSAERLILYVPTPLCTYTFMCLHLYVPTPLCTDTPTRSPPRDHSLHQHGNVQSRKRARSASSPARKRSACAVAHVLPCRCDPKDHSARAAQSQRRDHAQARPG
jgi:hypothetical protein